MSLLAATDQLIFQCGFASCMRALTFVQAVLQYQLQYLAVSLNTQLFLNRIEENLIEKYFHIF